MDSDRRVHVARSDISARMPAISSSVIAQPLCIKTTLMPYQEHGGG